MSSATRTIAQWRQFFRRSGGDAPPRSRGDGDFDSTQWAITEWSETQPGSLALSEPPTDQAAGSPR